MTIRVHVPGIFHTQANHDFDHCAFTTKTAKFSKMVSRLKDFDVRYYGNEGGTVEAQEFVPMLDEREFALCFPPLKPGEMHGDRATMSGTGWIAFDLRLREAMTKRVQPLDIVCHPFGRAHAELVKSFPQAIHVEPGVGYPDLPFGAFRIFESESWRHYHWGHEERITLPDGKLRFAAEPGIARNYSWVIPNSWDLQDWPIANGKQDYVLFMGRIHECKGLSTLTQIIRAWDELHPNDGMRFVIAGQGDIEPFMFETCKGRVHLLNRIDYRGSVTGKARAELVGNARCMIMPTNYVEPFGGAGVEGMLTGTPLIASDWGAFTETVEHGVTGYRCKMLGDWLRAIEVAGKLSRDRIASVARRKYSLEACGLQYDRALRMLHALAGEGWNERTSFNVA